MLRISFLRHLRENKNPSGSSGKKKRPFYLEDVMRYLIPYTKSRYQSGTAEPDEDEKNCSQMKEDRVEENVNIPHKNIEETQEGNEICPSDLLACSFVSKETPERFSFKKRKIQSTESLNNKYILNTKRKESSDEEDSDLLFLKSLLPDLKKLNDAQKRRFKQRIFVLYDEILNEDSVRVPLQSP